MLIMIPTIQDVVYIFDFIIFPSIFASSCLLYNRVQTFIFENTFPSSGFWIIQDSVLHFFITRIPWSIQHIRVVLTLCQYAFKAHYYSEYHDFETLTVLPVKLILTQIEVYFYSLQKFNVRKI